MRSNPWAKKNPFMSMWLSGANSVLGAARGHTVAATKREAASLSTQLTKDMLGLWTSVLMPAAPPSKTRSRKTSQRKTSLSKHSR